jgi:hypothetical protein
MSAKEPADEMPDDGKTGRIGRGALQIIGGLIPFAGGLFSAAAGAWSENEQRRVNEFFRAWLQMLQDEMLEKQETIIEITARLDMHDEKVTKRIESVEYQSLMKKAFRNWAGAESLKKREYIRNILSNAAASTLTSDDVVSLFLEWLQRYSEFHFMVIGNVYSNPGSSRADVWENLGKEDVREDSAEADLFKLLFRDLSTGGVIRQHRETDYAGNFVTKPRSKTRTTGPRVMKSAFDDKEQYELTALGQQFVHYAMTDVPVKINYSPQKDEAEVVT